MPLLHKPHDRFLSGNQLVGYVICVLASGASRTVAAANVLDRVGEVLGDVQRILPDASRGFRGLK